MKLRLNPTIDVTAARAAYAKDRIVQVPDLFEPEVAATLAQIVASLPFRLVTTSETGEVVLYTQPQLQAMSPEVRQALSQGQRERAARNIGYTYLGYPMIQAVLEGWDKDHPIHALTAFLNGPEALTLARDIIDCPGLTKIDAQASAYMPGHYLTRHVDDGRKKERRAAYTLGLTPVWEPDWGGLLLFLDSDMNVSRGLTPRYNTLTVFDGLMVHAVSAVAPFAPRPRLSVVGWFRDDPRG